MVHDDSDPSLALRDGDVRIVQARNGAANGVVIRLRAPCEEFALKPSTVAARPRRLLAL